MALTALSLSDDALTVNVDAPINVLAAEEEPASITPPELEDLLNTELLTVSKSTVTLSAFRVPPMLPIVSDDNFEVRLILCPLIRPALTWLALTSTSDWCFALILAS